MIFILDTEMELPMDPESSECLAPDMMFFSKRLRVWVQTEDRFFDFPLLCYMGNGYEMPHTAPFAMSLR